MDGKRLILFWESVHLGTTENEKADEFARHQIHISVQVQIIYLCLLWIRRHGHSFKSGLKTCGQRLAACSTTTFPYGRVYLIFLISPHVVVYYLVQRT